MQAGFRAERALGYTQILAATSTQLAIPLGCTLILVTPEAQAVRWRDDGTPPTATVGYPLAVGVELQYSANQMASLRFIEQALSTKLNVTFYGS